MQINNSKNVDINVVQSDRCIHCNRRELKSSWHKADNSNKAEIFTPNHHCRQGRSVAYARTQVLPHRFDFFKSFFFLFYS